MFGLNGLSGGGLFAQTRPIRCGRRTSLQAAAAGGNASPWFAGPVVGLNDAWSADPPQFRVGGSRSPAVSRSPAQGTERRCSCRI